MKKEWKFFLVAVMLIMVSGLVGFYAIGKTSPDLSDDSIKETGQVSGTKNVDGEDYVTRLARALTAKGVVLYGSHQSDNVKQQKNLFGASVVDLNYVECDSTEEDANPDECTGRNIQVYPTWVFQDELYPGIMPLAELAKLIGF